MRLRQQIFDGTRRECQFLQAILVAREVEQVIDQLHQALHFFVDGVEQVGLAGLRGKLRPLAEQPERHVHAGHRRSQFMGRAQHKFAAYPLEGSLLGDIVQHHHRAKNVTLSVADRGQAISQQARLAIDLDTQIFRRPLQRAAAQHQLQLLIQFRPLKCAAQALAETVVVPAQLALGDRVEVLEMALAVDHQQAVVDAVEHRLQALLAGQ